mgnify:CR=1 FL=1|tara:strand:+ start:101 stop:970 length:870 start_codon:yes stop_codon:yes gene_type:complete
MKNLKLLIQEILREALTPEDFEDIEATAQLAHLGQTRRDGSEYIRHPQAVRDLVQKYYPDNLNAQALALLHDSLEDAPGNQTASQSEMIELISGSISDREDFEKIIFALNLMTHDKSTDSYEQYLTKVFSNPLASIVKISDLIHNLSDNPKQTSIEKYAAALSLVEIPPWVNFAHRQQLEEILGLRTMSEFKLLIKSILIEKKKPKCQRKNGKRDYKCEYQNYGGASKKGKSDRNKRNQARRQAKRDGKVKKGDGKEIDHKKPLSKGGSNAKSNQRVVSRATNRKKADK